MQHTIIYGHQKIQRRKEQGYGATNIHPQLLPISNAQNILICHHIYIHTMAFIYSVDQASTLYRVKRHQSQHGFQ